MKYITSVIATLDRVRAKTVSRNVIVLFKFIAFLAGLIVLYSFIFHLIMAQEGRDFSWLTGFYWTLTVMSTLGFGDITFHTDTGKVFTMFVLLSGVLFLLIILPFTFIQFFYVPWLEAQSKAKTMRRLPAETKGHVIITNFDPMTVNLVRKLEQYGYQYVLLSPDLQEHTELRDQGYHVVHGDLGDPRTYELVRADQASLVVVTNDDVMATNIAFTVRSVSETVPIVTNADMDHSIDIMVYAGSTHVYEFMRILGISLGRKTLGLSRGTNVIGEFGQLLIAEAPVQGTHLEGQTLAEIRLRELTGITVVGIWDRGEFELPWPEMVIKSSMILMLAGSREQLTRYEKMYCAHLRTQDTSAPVLVIGGGRVGLAAVEALEENGISYKVIEKRVGFIKNNEHHVHGNAADIKILHQAGIREARSVIITTHDDPTNIYLTIYCRQLRPDIQIISRATMARTVSKLHKAGADLVMSYSTMSANTIVNLLKPDEVLTVAEGLIIFRAPVAGALIDSTLVENRIRALTGCSVIAINRGGELLLSPDPFTPLKDDEELILIGTVEAEKKFLESFGSVACTLS
ncbi:MAG: NAD-binding protein [Desulfobulbaceae bacterium]|uniref:NAD-binding protein n=1 Tax=Candidatus Desulfatifera sulfidica TaxID=2841691 RepID=A0A8J6N9T8_9BACT|nr:NAD-binding protein [Candidatus Desulfatifera sulfidica]